MPKPVRLSASTLGIYEDCKRCFYSHIVNGVKRPETPFSSLPNGIDRALKSYANKFRGALPPQLHGKVSGVLFSDMEKMKKYQAWQSGLQFSLDTKYGNVTLIGALDDLLVDGDLYTPLDWKTRGSAPKDSGIQYYGRQANCYSLLLFGNGMKPSGSTVLCYWYPESIGDGSHVKFQSEVFVVPSDYREAMNTIEGAMAVLAGMVEPESSQTCGFCNWAKQYLKGVANGK